MFEHALLERLTVAHPAFPFAVESNYGSPDDLKALIDAAHARDLMVLLDVVYNHFGPDGNYLASYSPQFFRLRRP